MSYVLDAFRARLVADWNPSDALGYSPSTAPSDDKWLSIHTGEYDDSLGFPQIAISSVSTLGAPHGYRSNGTGVVMTSTISVDINCWAGTEDDVGTDPDPDEVADALGQHVRELLHASQQWLIHPDSGERVAQDIIPSEPMVFPDPGTKTDWRALVEVSCERRRDPPAAD